MEESMGLTYNLKAGCDVASGTNSIKTPVSRNYWCTQCYPCLLVLSSMRHHPTLPSSFTQGPLEVRRVYFEME